MGTHWHTMCIFLVRSLNLYRFLNFIFFKHLTLNFPRSLSSDGYPKHSQPSLRESVILTQSLFPRYSGIGILHLLPQPVLSIPWCIGVPKITPNFSNSLEELTRLSIQLYLWLWFITEERIQSKLIKRKRQMGHIQRKARVLFHCSQ